MAQATSSVTVKVETNSNQTNVQENQGQSKPRRVKRVIHCSDGVYEEFSSDEDGVCKMDQSSLVDPKSLNWGPWMVHLSSKALAACDYVGETLADFLGITTPKYLYEIEEARRMKAEEEAAKKATDVEMAGWAPRSDSNPSANPSVVLTNSPVSILP